MSSCENDKGVQGSREEEEGGRSGWAADFFNGIFKAGFKLEVISMFTFERRKLKKHVRLCECACVHLYVRAGSNYSILQAFKPTAI